MSKAAGRATEGGTMRAWLVRGICLLIALSAAVPSHAAAEPTTVAPDFDMSLLYHAGCEGLIRAAASCAGSGSIEVNGHIEATLEVESAAVVGYDYASAAGFMRARRVVDAPGRALIYTVTYRVNAATAGVDRGTLRDGMQNGPSAYVMFEVASDACECGDGQVLSLVSYGEAVEPGVYSSFVVVRPRSGQPIPPGAVEIEVGFYADAQHGTSFFAPIPDTGRTTLHVDLDILAVTQEIVA